LDYFTTLHSSFQSQRALFFVGLVQALLNSWNKICWLKTFTMYTNKEGRNTWKQLSSIVRILNQKND